MKFQLLKSGAVTFSGAFFLAVVIGLGGSLTGLGQVDAQDGGKRSKITTNLTKPEIQKLRKYFNGNSTSKGEIAGIEFKAPAGGRTEIFCNMGASGIHCSERLVDLKCPTEVNIQLPGGGSATAPVNCTGPDNDGNCECDFI